MAEQTTTKYGFSYFNQYDVGWHTGMNNNFINLDSLLANMTKSLPRWHLLNCRRKVLSLDGTSQDAYITDASQSGLDVGVNDFMVEFWCRTTGTDGTVVCKNQGAGYAGYLIRVDSAGKIWFRLTDGTNTASGASNTALNDGLWHHVAITFDRSGNADFYLDGKADGTVSISSVGNLDNDQSFYLGISYGTSYRYAGELDEVRFYKFGGGLPGAIAETVRQHGIDPFYLGSANDLISRWTFNLGNCDDEYGGNDLTEEGSPTYPADGKGFIGRPGVVSCGVEQAGAWMAPQALTIQKAYIYCRDTGLAGSTVIDVNKNGVTIFTTQTNRPSLTYDDIDKKAVSGAPDITDLSEGDVITIDADQAATGAVDLSVILICT